MDVADGAGAGGGCSDWPMGRRVPIGPDKEVWNAIGLDIHTSSLAVVLETVETRLSLIKSRQQANRSELFPP